MFHFFGEFGAGLEFHHFFCWNGDGCAGGRVHAFALRLFLHSECAKSHECYFVAFHESGGHYLDSGIDRRFCLCLADAGFNGAQGGQQAGGQNDNVQDADFEEVK